MLAMETGEFVIKKHARLSQLLELDHKIILLNANSYLPDSIFGNW